MILSSSVTKNSLSNKIWLKTGRTRWLKRFLGPLMPDIGKFRINPGFKLFLDLKDYRGPSFYIMYGGRKAFGHYELGEKKEILNYLSDDSVFLDIGANIGLFSFYIFCNKPSVKVFSFEPNPLLFRCLQLTVSENQITTVKPINMGVSDSVTRLELFLDKTDSGGHSVNRESFPNNIPLPSSVSVEVCTLDKFAEREHLDRVDFIKIDAQDHEDKILNGARLIIEKFRPGFLIEFNNTLLKPKYISSEQFPLKDYQWKPIDEGQALRDIDQLAHFAEQQLKQGFLHTNYLFIRNRS